MKLGRYALSFAALSLSACGPEAPSATPLVDPTPRAEASLPPARWIRLLDRQIDATLADLLGEEPAGCADTPAGIPIAGLEIIGAAEGAPSPIDVFRYEASAWAVAECAVNGASKLTDHLACDPSGPTDAACHESFVRAFGRRAFRRPLEAGEVARYVAVAQTAAAAEGDFQAGLRDVIASMLQSPSFLYRTELGTPSGDARVLSAYELASKLSFFLIDRAPSAALLDAAERGDLDDPEGIVAAAEAILDAEPQAARSATRAFFSEVLRLRGLEDAVKDASVYPGWSRDLALAMREETLALVDDVTWDRDADIRELLTAQHAFLDDDLAALYGVSPPAGGRGRVDLPSAQGRRGVLGQGSFLARQAHATSTSPTLRGRFVLEALLCESMPPPPANVASELPEGGGPTTLRDRVERHRNDPACAGCHARMDPIGLALENFDGIGAFRTEDAGEPIDASGELSDRRAFAGPAEMVELLAAGPEVPSCFARHLYAHATAHIPTDEEVPAIDDLSIAFGDGGYRWRHLLLDVVASESFRTVAPFDVVVGDREDEGGGGGGGAGGAGGGGVGGAGGHGGSGAGECTSDADCDDGAADTVCIVARCKAGECGVEIAPAGTPCPGGQCAASGQCVAVAAEDQ